MTTWHEINQSNDADKTVEAIKKGKSEKIPSSESSKLNEKVGAVAEKLMDVITSVDGGLNRDAETIFKTWSTVADNLSSQAKHVSTIRIVNKATKDIIEDGAPPAALAILALAFQSASLSLIDRIREVEPELYEEIKKRLESAKSE